MIRNIDFVTSIPQLLHPTGRTSSPQDPVAPGGGPPFLAGIVFVRARVIFVRRAEGDGAFTKPTESEGFVVLQLLYELVVSEEATEIPGTECGGICLPPVHINTIVEVAIQLGSVPSGHEHRNEKRED